MEDVVCSCGFPQRSDPRARRGGDDQGHPESWTIPTSGGESALRNIQEEVMRRRTDPLFWRTLPRETSVLTELLKEQRMRLVSKIVYFGEASNFGWR